MHNNLIKVASETRLARDLVSQAIINTDNEGYENYITARARRKALTEKLDKHDDDIASIKQELGDIKNMLSIIVSNIQNREK